MPVEIPLTLADDCLAVFVDDTGHEALVTGHPVYGLGGCAALARDLDSITNAIAAQAARLLNCSPSFYNEPMIRLSELIARHSRLHQTFFTNSGAEAIEGAIKLARKWGQKYRNGAYEIITMDHGFHGRTLAAMSASGKPQWERLFDPKCRDFPKCNLTTWSRSSEPSRPIQSP
jgi:acetylornithine/N-succinyldiaminopimelate aminotransferase